MRTKIGLLIWVAVLIGGVGTWVMKRDLFEPFSRLIGFAKDRPFDLQVSLARPVTAERGTLVMMLDSERFLRRVGRVSKVVERDGGMRLGLSIYPREARRLDDRVQATFFTVPGNAAWIVSTLIPRDRARAVGELWQKFYEDERAAIYETLWPVVKESLEELFRFYEKEIPRVIAAHEERIGALVEKHRHGAFEKELMPALQSVAWDIAQREFNPLLEEIGREFWGRLPVWGLTWRYAFQSIPFTDDAQVKRRFREFLERDGLPIIRAHAPDLLKAFARVTEQTFKHPKVSAALRKTVAEVTGDPAFLALVRELVADLTLRNTRLRGLLRDRWEKKGLKRAVTQVGTRFEPLIKKVVNSIVLSQDEERLNPRLSQVLRSRVLKKDEVWILLEPRDGSPLSSGQVVEGRIDGGS